MQTRWLVLVVPVLIAVLLVAYLIVARSERLKDWITQSQWLWPAAMAVTTVSLVLAYFLVAHGLGVQIVLPWPPPDVLPRTFFGLLTLAFAGCFWWSVTGEKSGIWLESNWGGFGDGLGGWEISPALVYLLLTVFFASLLMFSTKPATPSDHPSPTPTVTPAGDGSARVNVSPNMIFAPRNVFSAPSAQTTPAGNSDDEVTEDDSVDESWQQLPRPSKRTPSIVTEGKSVPGQAGKHR